MTNLFKKITANWQLKLGVLLTVMLIASAILKILTPPEASHSQNNWNSLEPGVSSARDLVAQLGKPQTITQEQNQQVYEYQFRDEKTVNTQVGIDDKQTIVFVKEYLKYNPQHTLAQYIDEFGSPDLELYTSRHVNIVKAYVFLDEGVAVFAHQKDLSVKQKWYFIPTTKEIFLNSWKNELFAEEPGPETFN